MLLGHPVEDTIEQRIERVSPAPASKATIIVLIQCAWRRKAAGIEGEHSNVPPRAAIINLWLGIELHAKDRHRRRRWCSGEL